MYYVGHWVLYFCKTLPKFYINRSYDSRHLSITFELYIYCYLHHGKVSTLFVTHTIFVPIRVCSSNVSIFSCLFR